MDNPCKSKENKTTLKVRIKTVSIPSKSAERLRAKAIERLSLTPTQLMMIFSLFESSFRNEVLV